MSDVLSPEKQQASGSDLVAVMDQYSSTPAETPLHMSKKSSVAQGSASAGVTMKEIALLGHLTLRGDSNDQGLVDAVSKVLGLPLPTLPLTSSEKDGKAICWMSPDEWLILVPGEQAYDVEVALRENLTGHFSIVNQSGGQTIIELSGPQAVNILKKSTTLDIHPKEFPVGKIAGSVLAKTSAVFRRADELRWQIVVRRSFADYIWRWLSDAGKEYGLSIEK
ncbi:sarcosine oxidase subunit gamma [Vibrio mangrovi]|uniref:Sarcosine oxidase subunit gamma family protein n=1 Tax=Vibrio mangrovi TaxID=474394 RepID=A0A1Y6IN26_9VIBR|nr:sarcosine oxidase subunit gamma family protein [Vibrio mangrovi]MDW6004139.1 sarcosine oxidase subunit gamma family protein [Vibrio mangrovi]SMR99064.1 Sarcosine oxidase, gamma subunit family [Vibrio mangrovi]